MTRGHGEKMSRRQEEAIAALLVSPTVQDAAARLGINVNTLRTWRDNPTFEAAFTEAKRDLLRGTIARLQHAMCAVSDRLERDVNDTDPAIRFKACSLLISATLRGTEALHLNERVASLEAAAQPKGKP